MRAIQVGEFLGNRRFEIIGRIGAGGMGAVFLAYDNELQTRVALKMLKEREAGAILLFKKEFRALQDLQHPNLIRLGELFEQDRVWFFTMELLSGCDFLTYVRPTADRKDKVGRGGTDSGERTEHNQGQGDPPKEGATAPAYSQVDGSRPATAPPTVLMAMPLTTPMTAPEDDPPTDEDEHFHTADLPTDDPPRSETQAQILNTQLDQPESWPPLPHPLPPPTALSMAAFDEARLRATLGQLGRALCVLHEARKVHRDIKPSNVQVTGEGRLVILDFGIISDTVQEERWGMSLSQGTAAYMAPEQAGDEPVSSSADWYSVGVMLYQALTGRLPFAGTPGEIIANKRRFMPAPPDRFIANLPADLTKLCMDLLNIVPARRPCGEEILERLKVVRPVDERGGSLDATVFTGRQAELDALLMAYQDSRSGAGVTALVHGESGVGKSFLVRHFVDQLSKQEPQLLLFIGRCYERESVSYKAVDTVVDQVSRYLMQLPPAIAAELLPPHVALLAQIFPVLEALVGLAQTPAPAVPADAVEIRKLVFASLRELLDRLARRRPLVIVIDDLQWADADSFVLLSELLRPPAPPQMLLICTVRATSDKALQARLQNQLSRLTGEVLHLRVEKLSTAEASQLALQLLGDEAAANKSLAELIAREAQGHPLFIDEMVRQRRMFGREGALLRLDDALWARVSRLDVPARELLELVAVAGRPLSQQLMAQAAALGPEQFDTLASVLRAAHLVRRTGPGKNDTIESYHDRVRESVVNHLPAATRVRCHEKLALTLEQSPDADAEALLTLWEGAGDKPRAAGYALRAAEKAEAALAFDRAARLYQKALALAELHGEKLQSVRIRLAETLANANRSSEAARVFMAAAKGARGRLSYQLRFKAIDNFFRSGHMNEGYRTLGEVMSELGIYFPKTPREALAVMLVRRLQLKLRGLKFREVDPRTIAPEQALRLDACLCMASQSGSDLLRGQEFAIRYLLLSLEAGDTARIAHGLFSEAMAHGSLGDFKRARTTLDLACTLVAKHNRPELNAHYLICFGILRFLEGQWKQSTEKLDAAHELVRNQCVGMEHLMTRARQARSCDLMYLGQLERLSLETPAYLKEAEDRGDQFETTNLRTQITPILCLMRDEPAQAHLEISQTMSQWPIKSFDLQHLQAMLSMVQVDLYEGKAVLAYHRLQSTQPRFRRSLIPHAIKLIRFQNCDALGRVALASAVVQRDKAQERQDESLTMAKQLTTPEGHSWSDALAWLLRASVAALRGNRTAAMALLGRAIDDLVKNDMALHVAAARWRLGELRGGAEGAALVADADAALRKQLIVHPARWIEVLAPGFRVNMDRV
ncbi:serine/threonine-protein kinase [Haliangium sp. UPWRP_2]|uniref:protein kinase domain-containing protein n=1 Tax=Haliangium sp. UPWRP_2 TaxID=1931276 RepID=UPI000B542E98|nr:serine/threonine-protein kinase [Haliangium sp. UPWRP_2]PSM31860.1 NACHT domain-containing protein [Haliangium sp. UPWRP_2]